MQVVQKLSIRNKLTLITMSSSLAAVLVACLGFAGYDIVSVREAMRQSLSTQSAIIAGNCTASVSFRDPNDAAGILQSLSAQRHIEVAAVYTADAKVLAVYRRAGAAREMVPVAPPADGARFGSGFLEANTPIIVGGQQIGTAYLRSDVGELYARIRDYGVILLALISLSTATAFLLVFRMQRLISKPIVALAQTARNLTLTQDYSLRAGKFNDDEIGNLTDCFNDMIAQVQARDVELARHRDRLEAQVQARTSELVQLNRQLSEEKERAEEASRAKSAFLANMSHEIRTPMTAIVGYADLMLEPDQTLSDRQNSLQVIRRNGRHLLDLINDILDISKIEAGKMSIEPIAVNLPENLADLISLLRPRATGKGLAFNLKVTGGIPSIIHTDQLRLRQILMNLLGNAIKFTHQGQITLEVKLEQERDRPMLRFDVHDTGIGISDQSLRRLFQSFSQADESMTRRFGGSGLGLAISQKLANLLGGSISVTSRLGQGSTFTARIDPGRLDGVEMLENVSESMLPHPSEAPGAQGPIVLRGRILLVEDGPDNQRLISLHLRKAGAVVDIAENGRIGIEKFEDAVTAGDPYDLVLMDMQMPELDGYGATSLLRSRGVTTPIIALTAHAMAEDREKCIKAGCTDYMTKPIEKTLLLTSVSQHMNRAAANSGAASTAQPLRSTFADDADMREALADFINELPDKVQRMEALLEQQDLEQLRRVVHQLKGAGGGYGFASITQRAAAAEQRIKGQQSLDQIAAGIQDLIQLIRSIDGFVTDENSSKAADFQEKRTASFRA
jgi:two-component system, sensor histidine kinase